MLVRQRKAAFKTQTVLLKVNRLTVCFPLWDTDFQELKQRWQIRKYFVFPDRAAATEG